eukprot:1156504-Pelagomonas_calceolata.AAC.8
MQKHTHSHTQTCKHALGSEAGAGCAQGRCAAPPHAFGRAEGRLPQQALVHALRALAVPQASNRAEGCPPQSFPPAVDIASACAHKLVWQGPGWSHWQVLRWKGAQGSLAQGRLPLALPLQHAVAGY